MAIFEFELGARVRETVTGVKGTITGRYEFLNGCVRYTIEFEKDGEPKEFTTDEDRLELVEASAREEPKSRTGGPRPTPARPSPGR